MEEKMKQVLYKWLEIDLVNIAKKMGLSDKSCDVNLELLMDTIRCLDYESVIVEKPSINYIITVIGLMWEHVDHTKFDLRKFVIKILSRIGYPTSAIICDKDFDKENGTFSGLDSWIDEVSLTINQMKNEIMVANQKYLLTDYQKQIWDSMDSDKVLGISAPTSAGKSFVILLKLVDRLINDNIDIVYIVPTLSLLNQVTEDFNRELKKVGVTDYWISNSFDDQQLSNKKNIYIMTQEKAIAAFSDTEKAFTKRLILVADDMKQSESPFLKCMQVGAFGVVERCMIEMGVPRESALYLYKEIFDEKEIKVENRLELEQIIREKIRLEYKNIPYWIQVQLDFLI